MPDRREFLRGLSGVAAAAAALSAAADAAAAGRTPGELAADEDFWRPVQQAFAVDRSLINLNNGGVSPAPRVVMDALFRGLSLGNEAPSFAMWRWQEPRIESARASLARMFGCDPEEMAVVRNASEALETCLLGLPLKAGDQVLTTDQDYPRMLTALRQRQRREGVELVTFPIPTPPKSAGELVDAYAERITSRTRVLLVSHVVNLTGLVMPVKEIVALGRRHGCEVIVDGAHAFAQLPFTRDELGCDYYGTSLHKWLFAPIGTGFLSVRREKIAGLWPLMAAPAEMDADIRKFEEIGTHPAAPHNAIVEAVAFTEALGVPRKAARLRYLRERWMSRLASLPRVRFLTSRDPALSCGLGSFALDGIAVEELGRRLLEKHRVFVTPIVRDDFQCVRVTPSVYTTLAEVDAFCDGVERIARA